MAIKTAEQYLQEKGINTQTTSSKIKSAEEYLKENNILPKKQSLIVSIPKSVFIGITKPFVRAGVNVYNVAKSTYGLASGKFIESAETPRKLPLYGNVKPLSKPIEAVGAAADIALTVGSLGTASLGKEVLKQSVKTGFKTTLKATGKQLAKNTIKDFFAGAISGTAAALQEDRKAKDIVKEAATSGLVSTVATPLLGGVIKTGIKGTSAIGKTIKGGLEKGAEVLEKKAIPKEVSREGKLLWEQLDKPVTTFGQKVAGKAAQTARTLLATPSQAKKLLLNKYESVGRFVETAKKKLGVEVPDLLDKVEATQYRGGGIAESKLNEYANIVRSYGEDWKYVKLSSRYLDSLDRLANENKVTGGKTQEEIQDNLQGLYNKLGADKMSKVIQGQRDLQVFLNQELLDAVDSGRLSQKGYRAIKAKHPNYIPHDVLDFLDEEEVGKTVQQGVGKSLNMAKSGIEEAKGSTREIDDIDNAIVRRLFRQNLLNENNKTINAIIDVGEQMNDGSFIPLRTSENVNKRIGLLQQLKNQFLEQRKTYRQDKTLSKRLGKIEKDINSTEKEMNNLLDEAQSLAADWDIPELPKINIYDNVLTNKRIALSEIENKIKNIDAEIIRLSDEVQTKASDFIAPSKIKPLISKVTFNERKSYTLKAEKIQLEQFIADYTEKKQISSFVKGQESTIEKLFIKAEKKEKRISQLQAKLQVGDDATAKKELIELINQRNEDITNLKEEIKKVKDIKIKPVDIPDGFEKISRFKNGVKEDWLIPKEMGIALKNLDPDSGSAIMNWINKSTLGKISTIPADTLRSLTTQYNPVFIARNITRDAQTVLITAHDEYIKGLTKVLTMNKKEANELYDLALKSGALQGNIYREQMEAEQIFSKKMNELFGDNKLSTYNPKNIIEKWGQKSEDFAKLLVFKGALLYGKAPEEAAKIARNSTIDFGRSGSLIQVLNRYIPFLNARIQGFSNLITSIKQDPTKVVRNLYWSAAIPQIALTAYNSNYTSYKDTPDDQKRKFWIIMIGESQGRDYNNKRVMIPHYIKIPKSEAQQPLSNIVERVLTIAKQKYPDNTFQFIKKLIGDTSPVTDSGILPAGLQQAIELRTNYSLFRDAPIESDYTKIKNERFKTDEIDPRYRIKTNTSELSKYIGDILNWSPTKIDYVIRTGLMNDLVKIFDLPVTLTDKEKGVFEKMTEIPILQGFIGKSRYSQEEANKKLLEQQKIKEKNAKKIENILKRD